MAYERDDPRSRPEGRERNSNRGFYGRDEGRAYGDRDDDRGFFERAGDEIASWFGDEPDHRQRPDYRGDRPSGRPSFERGQRSRYDRPEMGRERFSGAGGFAGGSEEFSDSRAFGGRREQRSRQEFDPHYQSWRERQIAALDRDYDEYRREHQSRFESDFGSWRERRVNKRSLLSGIRADMEVVGNDEGHVGTVDRVAGDRLILTKSDPESGGVHHSLSCADIDRVEENRIILECTTDEAKNRWRDENRSRALFEREDQGEMGPRILDRSFEGTYR